MSILGLILRILLDLSLLKFCSIFSFLVSMFSFLLFFRFNLSFKNVKIIGSDISKYGILKIINSKSSAVSINKFSLSKTLFLFSFCIILKSKIFSIDKSPLNEFELDFLIFSKYMSLILSISKILLILLELFFFIFSISI